MSGKLMMKTGGFAAIVFSSFVFVFVSVFVFVFVLFSVFVITVDIREKSVTVSGMMKTSGFQR